MTANNYISDLLLFCYFNEKAVHLGIESTDKNRRVYSIT